MAITLNSKLLRGAMTKTLRCDRSIFGSRFNYHWYDYGAEIVSSMANHLTLHECAWSEAHKLYAA